MKNKVTNKQKNNQSIDRSTQRRGARGIWARGPGHVPGARASRAPTVSEILKTRIDPFNGRPSDHHHSGGGGEAPSKTGLCRVCVNTYAPTIHTRRRPAPTPPLRGRRAPFCWWIDWIDRFANHLMLVDPTPRRRTVSIQRGAMIDRYGVRRKKKGKIAAFGLGVNQTLTSPWPHTTIHIRIDRQVQWLAWWGRNRALVGRPSGGVRIIVEAEGASSNSLQASQGQRRGRIAYRGW
jgi:hypothetical protein